jgi:redox-sensitive bicupin YhaK (pirin superfamily)
MDLGAEEFSGLRLVASRGGRDGSMRIHQDATLSVGRLGAGEAVTYRFAPGRHGWVQVVRGRVGLNGAVNLAAGDGAAISEVAELRIEAGEASEFLLFDLA